MKAGYHFNLKKGIFRNFFIEPKIGLGLAKVNLYEDKDKFYSSYYTIALGWSLSLNYYFLQISGKNIYGGVDVLMAGSYTRWFYPEHFAMGLVTGIQARKIFFELGVYSEEDWRISPRLGCGIRF